MQVYDIRNGWRVQDESLLLREGHAMLRLMTDSRSQIEDVVFTSNCTNRTKKLCVLGGLSPDAFYLYGTGGMGLTPFPLVTKKISFAGTLEISRIRRWRNRRFS